MSLIEHFQTYVANQAAELLALANNIGKPLPFSALFKEEQITTADDVAAMADRMANSIRVLAREIKRTQS